MNYSQTSIANLALNRIGARGTITDINENTPNAKKVLLVWDAIFQEVLSERDWKFAKTRQPLQLSNVTPLYTYRFAWALPGDFLRFVRPRRRQLPYEDYVGIANWYYGWGPEGTGWYSRHDPPFWPYGYDWKVETLTAGWLVNPPDPPIPYPDPFPSGKYVLTNYGGCTGQNVQGQQVTTPAAITYIQLITDYTQLMPGFVNALAFRLAAELAIGITEDVNKAAKMHDMYREALNSSEAQNESSDFEKFEDGSDTWVVAGRRVSGWGGGWGGGGIG